MVCVVPPLPHFLANLSRYLRMTSRMLEWFIESLNTVLFQVRGEDSSFLVRLRGWSRSCSVSKSILLVVYPLVVGIHACAPVIGHTFTKFFLCIFLMNKRPPRDWSSVLSVLIHGGPRYNFSGSVFVQKRPILHDAIAVRTHRAKHLCKQDGIHVSLRFRHPRKPYSRIASKSRDWFHLVVFFRLWIPCGASYDSRALVDCVCVFVQSASVRGDWCLPSRAPHPH